MVILDGGKVLTMAGAVHDPGRIFIRDGKIVSVGGQADGPLPPAEEGWQVVDCAGKWLIPGLIDAHTHVGIGEQGFGREGMDVNETTDPVTPHLRAIDATNPDDAAFGDALGAGITTINIMPGSANVIGGLAMAVKTVGSRIDQMVVRHPTGLKAAMGENPKRTYGDQKKMPGTRLGIAGLLRENFTRAQNYLAKQAQQENGKPFERDLRMEALGMVLRREIPMRIHAHRADDILTALRVRDEFDFLMVLDHSTEAFKIPDELVRRNIPAVLGPLMTSRYKVELRERNLRSAARLVQAGVKVALTTDHWVVPIQHLLIGLILSVKDGLDRAVALELVTKNPAEVLGIADRVGTLEVGKDADIAVFSGDPLDLMSRVEQVWVNGEQAYRYEVEGTR
jgi:imidazolonepropionase-like amidohydrolase